MQPSGNATYFSRRRTQDIFLSLVKKWIISVQSVRIWENRMLVGSKERHALSRPTPSALPPDGKMGKQLYLASVFSSVAAVKMFVAPVIDSAISIS